MQPDIDTSANGNRARIADSFVAARRDGHALPDYPGDRPTALDDAYAVQDAALVRHGGTVAGWKVGRINPPIGTADRLAGPIFADQVIASDPAASDPCPAMPVYVGGFAAAEAEFLMRIGTAPDPAQRRFTREDARALIDSVHVGIEIASSPYPHINADGALVTISDFGNNNGLVVGAAVPNWRETDLLCWPVELWINDIRIGAAIAADMLDGPFGAVAFLAEHLAARGKPLVVGQWVSTGAVTGVHPVQVGDRVEARFDGAYRVGCTITAST